MLLSLLLIALIIAWTDPFLHYHAPFRPLEAVETDERSAMTGVAKHEYYETALIGSSMSENFLASWFEDGDFGGSCVKICLQGAHFSDYDVILKEVCAHPEVHNIVFCLDNYLLLNNPEEYPVTIPAYLSDPSLTTEAYYLWNKSVVTEYLPKFLVNNLVETEDDAYVWSHDYEFSKEIVKSVCDAQPVIPKQDELPFDTYFSFADSFLEGMKPYLEARPDITFYFYASPYNICYWEDVVRRGNLTAEICTLERVYKELLSYDNVRLFYFQDDYELITDLDHYRDYCHFDQSVNRMMYESMRDGKKEVSQSTYYDTLLAQYDFAAGYDYSAIFR